MEKNTDSLSSGDEMNISSLNSDWNQLDQSEDSNGEGTETETETAHHYIEQVNLISTMTNDHIHDVVVVGGGISGLSGAKLLHENGLDVVVLEARDRVGGRTYTKRDPKIDYVDLGGAYVGPGQNRVLRLIDEFGLQTYKINVKEDCLRYYNGKRIKFGSEDLPVGLCLWEKLDMFNFIRLLDQMGEEIPYDAPWNAPHAQEWDLKTFGQFVNENVWTKSVKQMAHTMITAFVTSEPYESSLLWFLWYIKQCGGVRPMLSTTDGGQERKLIGGTQQISEHLAERLKGRVLLDKPVVSISNYQNEYSIVKSLDGNEYKTKYVILALAPPMIHKIHFSPQLPPLRNQLNQRCPMGSAIKTIVYYETPFWKSKGFNGMMLLEGDDQDIISTFTYDDTKYDGKHPAIIGFIVGDKARTAVKLSKEQRLNLICQNYSRALNSSEANHPIHYEEQIWMGEQYSGGCYTIMCPPGFLTRYASIIREPIGSIHFAGTETATWWSGYMEGAVQAGERAAREILFRLNKISKREIWSSEPPNKTIPPVQYPPLTFWQRNLPSVGGLLKWTTILGLVGVTVASHQVIRCHFEYFKLQFPFDLIKSK